MNKNKIKLYYFLLITIISVKVVATIFSSGLSVHHGKKIAQLSIQKNNLLQQELILNTQLAEKASINNLIAQSDLTEYHNISDIIVINSNNTVASR